MRSVERSGVFPAGFHRRLVTERAPVSLEAQVAEYLETLSEDAPGSDLTAGIREHVAGIVAGVVTELGVDNPLDAGWRLHVYESEKIRGAIVICVFDATGKRQPLRALEGEIDRLWGAKGC